MTTFRHDASAEAPRGGPRGPHRGAPLADRDVADLRRWVAGPVLLPDDPGFAAEFAGYNSARVERPALAVGATGTVDVAVALAFARDRGLTVAVANTGHGRARSADGALLLNVSRMTDLTVDPAARVVRVGAGVPARRVAEAAAEHGLAAPVGSSGQVGLVGYALGGGLPVLGRTLGWAAERVRALELVTPDARTLRVTAESDPELFWAVRGGRDNFGVVTELELELVPLRTFFGGGLHFAAETEERLAELLGAYAAWTGGLPRQMHSSLAVVPFPDVPQLPPPLRGRRVAHLRVAWTGAPAEGEALLAGWRERGPLAVSWGELPATAVRTLHQEPDDPAPFTQDSALLDRVDDAVVRAFAEAAGPGAGRAHVVEVRHLGGALAQPAGRPFPGVRRSASHLLSAVSILLGPDGTPEATGAVRGRLFDAVAGRSLGRLGNFTGGGEDMSAAVAADAYEPAELARLRAVKARLDPGNAFRHNANIEPAGPLEGDTGDRPSPAGSVRGASGTMGR
ncbi:MULTISPECIES: FAD-binding oxidoreductase [Streptomyces]|nr:MULTISPECIES: FAD-binding oxidoreductase [Streptomyces]